MCTKLYVGYKNVLHSKDADIFGILTNLTRAGIQMLEHSKERNFISNAWYERMWL